MTDDARTPPAASGGTAPGTAALRKARRALVEGRDDPGALLRKLVLGDIIGEPRWRRGR